MFFGVGKWEIKLHLLIICGFFCCSFNLNLLNSLGGLVFASIDQVPDDLIDNAIILGCLSFVVAFLFLIDLTDPLGKRKTGSTQTNAIDEDTRTNKQHQKQLISTISTVDSAANLIDSEDRLDSRFQPQTLPLQPQQKDSHLQEHKSLTNNDQKQQQPPFESFIPPVQNQQQQRQSFHSYIPPEQLQHQQQQQRPNFQSYISPEQLQQEQNHQQNYHSYNPQTQQQQQRQVFPSHYVTEEFVQTQILPTVQQPVFAKVKQPTILNHFETEPYKKIFNGSTQQQQQQQQQYSSVAHKRYQDPPNFNDNLSYAEDFNMQNKQTYYPGQRVDQGKMIIRDYSKQKPDSTKCNCNEQHEHHDEDNEESPIKSGYVNHVAKLWDNRIKSSHKISPSKKNDLQGLSTVV